MYKNRYGKLKPVLYWFDLGTAHRYKKARSKVQRLLGKRGGYTGQIRSKNFIARAEQSEVPKVIARIDQTYQEKVEKIAKRYGYL
jgi:hypothetical protein